MNKTDLHKSPDKDGFFGEHGGQFIPEHLIEIMNEIRDSYFEIRDSKEFQEELEKLNKYYVGRPSPIYHAEKLSKIYESIKKKNIKYWFSGKYGKNVTETKNNTKFVQLKKMEIVKLDID